MQKNPDARFTCPVCQNYCTYGSAMLAGDDVCFDKVEGDIDSDAEDIPRVHNNCMRKLDAVKVYIPIYPIYRPICSYMILHIPVYSYMTLYDPI